MRSGLNYVVIAAIPLACGTVDAAEPEIVRDAPPSAPSAPSTPSAPSEPAASGASANDEGGPAQADGGADGEASSPAGPISCASTAPSGAKHAAPLPAYAGTCPAFATPPATTKLGDRELLVYRPATIAANEKLPVVFLWHWLGGSAEKMGTTLEVQAAVEKHRFVGVVPVSKSDALFRWPFESAQSQSRVDEESKFFDDMLACVAAAMPVNADCVSAAGVSAGALWSAQLASERSNRIASVVSLSGGVGGVVRDWKPATHPMPMLVLWGGADDVYPEKFPVIDFEDASKELEGALAQDGHFIVECVHNCGHSVPPFDAPPPGGLRFDMMWRFLLDHPYWLATGQSPYTSAPLPPSFPSWCAVGAGKATPRASSEACP